MNTKTKRIGKIVILSLLLIGCSSKKAIVNQTDKIEEINDKYQYTTGKCIRDEVYVEYLTFNRGDEVSIVDENDEYYYVDDNGLILAISKQYIRTDNEEQFVGFNGYTRNGSGFYSDKELNDRVYTFSLNEIVEVIDEFADVLYVKANDTYGYMVPSQVCKNKIEIYVAPKQTEVEPNNVGGGSSGSWSEQPQNPEPVSPSSGDGEDISLCMNKNVYRIINLAYKNSINGKVLADNTTAYLSVINRNDIVKVIDNIENKYKIIINGIIGKVDSKYIRLDNEKDYSSWNGYAYSSVRVFSDYKLNDSIYILSLNEIVNVIDEVDDLYVIELKDGEIGYIKKTNVSESKIYVVPKISTPINIGGQSDNTYTPPTDTPVVPEPDPSQEWTDPVL